MDFQPLPRRILIVDDESSMRMLISAVLRKAGNQVVTVENGVEAVEWLRNGNNEVDLVILDLHLPCMDGLETLKIMKQFRPEIAVLLCSGHMQDLFRASLESCSAIRGTLSKPFEPEQLLWSVRDALRTMAC